MLTALKLRNTTVINTHSSYISGRTMRRIRIVSVAVATVQLI